VRRIIYSLKHKAADCLAADFKDNECAALYRSMILGTRSEMPSWSRTLFVRSSSIHLFSISGLHILFFSRFLELLLSSFGIPRRLRMLLLAPCMAVYVMMSGAAPSALRSYYMMLVMVFAYLRQRQHSMENGLALSGLLLLIYNPGYMMHIGFLYSFILVYCLLRGRCIIMAAGEVLGEKQKLIPGKHRSLVSSMVIRPLFSLFSGGTVAWLGSVGLMMRSSCFIAFGAFMVNILLAPMASALVFLALPKTLAALFSTGLSSMLALCVETLLKALIIASKAGGTGILCVPCPKIEIPMLLAYYLLLTIALSGIRPFGARISALLTLCMIIITSLPGKKAEPCLLATTGQSGLPPCLAIIDSRRCTTIIQLGDYAASRSMLERLKEMGCADRIYIRVCSMYDIRGAMQFPEESIMAVAIDSRAFESIMSTRNFISEVVAHGAHLAPIGCKLLNGMVFRQSGEKLDVTLPHGEVSVINYDTGTTRVTTSEGEILEITQRISSVCSEMRLSANDTY
ncbi:MAG: ComEC/Rec2 family competence protein, partial [Victivallales bacterium]|nr:ComEC/Rec2 family competence protein [Victivallales bacterium]